MGQRAENFIVVCLHKPDGFSPEVGPNLLEMVEISHPDHWEFIHPGTVLAYFRARGRSKKNAANLTFSFDSLKSRDLRYKSVGMGQAQGRLLADIDFWGRVKSSPLGSVVGKAIECARQANCVV